MHMTGADLDQALRMRLRIDALNADYAQTIDDDRLETWPSFFTEAGVYRVITRENRAQGLPVALVYCKGRGMMADRIVAMRTANIFEPHVYCHVVGATRIVALEPGGCSAETNFSVLRTMADGATSIFACGKYVDRIFDDGKTLQFAERTAVIDSRRIDTLLVIPI
jgi:3-phenylpropionate/cinnamic acid dioxygenase small subunit